MGLDGSQTGIKIARKNINNLRYTDDITLMGERDEELKSLIETGAADRWQVFEEP